MALGFTNETHPTPGDYCGQCVCVYIEQAVRNYLVSVQPWFWS